MSPIKAVMDRPVVERPERAYRITFEDAGQRQEVAVEPMEIPYGSSGLPGSLLDIALGAGVALDHACGGVGACSTCHVQVKEGLESCPDPSEVELDQLEEASGLSLQSRLACQCVPRGIQDLVVEVLSSQDTRKTRV